MRRTHTVRCQVTGQELPLSEAIPVDLVRPALAEELKGKVPDWDPHGYVSVQELNRVRLSHVRSMLERDIGTVRELNEQVARSLESEETLSQHTDFRFEERLTIGQRLSDKLASFGGSWGFIMIFGAIIVIWMLVNVALMRNRGFDPYPFILLNLVLSCLAALQAPVIMMSQNRQEAKDRLRSENDYKVNLKAELEIRHLHEKLDRLVQDQWQHLLEIQQMQMEMLEEVAARKQK